MSIFYTYLYLDPSRQHPRRPEGEPIYVGKGKGNRYTQHSKRRPKHPLYSRLKSMQTKGVEPIIIFLAKDVDEELAFLVEQEAIDLYGRKDLGKGPLLNLTDGGEGPSGAKHSPETIAKRTAAIRTVMATDTYKHNMSVASKQAQANPEFKQRFSAIQKIAQNRPGVNERRSASQRLAFAKPEVISKIHFTITCPHCGKSGDNTIMHRWHFDKCKKM